MVRITDGGCKLEQAPQGGELSLCGLSLRSLGPYGIPVGSGCSPPNLVFSPKVKPWC